MCGFKITVNPDLTIRTVDILLGEMGVLLAAGMVGQPYHRFIPLLLESGEDAVHTVLLERGSRILRGYQTACFCGNIHADITINPLRDTEGFVVGAEIIREMGSTCNQPGPMWRERQLIEIGKSSASLAHGVRNPLNAIKGAVVYLKDTYGKESTLVEFAGIIEEEISKLDGFITRFLSASSLESEFVSLDFNKLLRRILAMSNFQAYAKKVTLTTEFGELPKVKADVFQLEHAVMNVINNSLEAMEEGGVLRLKTETIRRNDCDYAAIEVSDTGRGMSKNDLRSVLDSERKSRKEDGRGFGLFIVREIVQSHGGHLEISSRKDIGTTVRIFIPADLL